MTKVGDKIVKLQKSKILAIEGLDCPFYAFFTITKIAKTFIDADSDDEKLYQGSIRVKLNRKTGDFADYSDVYFYDGDIIKTVDDVNKHYNNMLMCKKFKTKIISRLKEIWDIDNLTDIFNKIKGE